MSSRIQAKGRRRRKTTTYVWIALLSITVIALIYWEQTALLYILATLGVTALLIAVAVADLGKSQMTEGTGTEDGTKLRSTFGSTPSSNS